MKKASILIALLLSFVACEAQTTWQDSSITFTVKYGTALFVRQVIGDQSEVRVAIATATEGITDTAAVRSVTISQGQLRDVYTTLASQPVGLVRAAVDELKGTLLPMLATGRYMGLATAIAQVEAAYDNQRLIMQQQGKRNNAGIQKAINAN